MSSTGCLGSLQLPLWFLPTPFLMASKGSLPLLKTSSKITPSFSLITPIASITLINISYGLVPRLKSSLDQRPCKQSSHSHQVVSTWTFLHRKYIPPPYIPSPFRPVRNITIEGTVWMIQRNSQRNNKCRFI